MIPSPNTPGAFYLITNAGRREEDHTCNSRNGPNSPGGKKGPVEMEVME